MHWIKCPWKNKHARLFEQNSGINGEMLEKKTKTKCKHVMTGVKTFLYHFCGTQQVILCS